MFLNRLPRVFLPFRGPKKTCEGPALADKKGGREGSITRGPPPRASPVPRVATQVGVCVARAPSWPYSLSYPACLFSSLFFFLFWCRGGSKKQKKNGAKRVPSFDCSPDPHATSLAGFWTARKYVLEGPPCLTPTLCHHRRAALRGQVRAAETGARHPFFFFGSLSATRPL